MSDAETGTNMSHISALRLLKNDLAHSVRIKHVAFDLFSSTHRLSCAPRTISSTGHHSFYRALPINLLEPLCLLSRSTTCRNCTLPENGSAPPIQEPTLTGPPASAKECGRCISSMRTPFWSRVAVLPFSSIDAIATLSRGAENSF